jgi:hypothetical protein
MKKNLKIVIYLIGLLILILVSLLLTGCPLWGYSHFDFTIENQTKDTLTILVNDRSDVGIKPGATVSYGFSMETGSFNIVAKNSAGDIVYSKRFSRSEIENLKNKVIIKQP